MGKVHPACAGQHPILSLLPLWVLALRVQAQGARKLRADRGFSPGPAISLAGFLVTLYGRIEVTPEGAGGSATPTRIGRRRKGPLWQAENRSAAQT